MSETHPSKNDKGESLFHYYVDLFEPEESLQKPQTVNLYEVLEKIFEDPNHQEPDLQPVREILLSLIEHGGRHTIHGESAPIMGKHPCARITSRKKDVPLFVINRSCFF